MCIRDRPDAQIKCDIVFVHGLGGDGNLTWCHEGLQKNYWPNWISEEFNDCNVWSYTYRATPAKFFGESSLLSSSSRDLLAKLEINSIGSNRPVIFVCHSLGGLVTKKVINRTKLKGKFDNFFSKGVGVAFFATPHKLSLIHI